MMLTLRIQNTFYKSWIIIKQLFLFAIVVLGGGFFTIIMTELIEKYTSSEFFDFYMNANNAYGAQSVPDFNLEMVLSAVSLLIMWIGLKRFAQIELPKFDVPYGLIVKYFAGFTLLIISVTLYDLYTVDEIVWENPTRILYSAISAGVGAGVSEEILFRGILLGLLLSVFARCIRWDVNIFIITTAVVFGWIHMGNTGEYQSEFESILQTILAGVSGVSWGYMYLITGRLYIPICMHILNNILAVGAEAVYVSDPTDLLSPEDIIEDPVYSVVLLLFIVLDMVLIYFLFQRWKQIKDDWYAKAAFMK